MRAAMGARRKTGVLVGTVAVTAILVGCGDDSSATSNSTSAAAESSATDESVSPRQSEGAEATDVPADAPLLEETTPPTALDPGVESITPDDEPAISNTTWTGTTEFANGTSSSAELGFDADGGVTFIEHGVSIRGISWSRTGNDIDISFDSGYSTETGTIDGDTITTTGENPDTTWTVTYQKKS